MLPDTVDPRASLLENEHPQINLVRWMHQCELMKRYYKAEIVFVIQHTESGYEIIVSSINNGSKFSAGVSFSKDILLFSRLLASPPEGLSINLSSGGNNPLPQDFHGIANLLSRPVLWPDGTPFGCLCVINAQNEDNQQITPFMLEPFQILLQQDLTLLCQSHRIESLSMRERTTGMLNRYGFIMMAPRQLNLGRRFGAHAGILFFELTPKPTQQLEEKHHKLLGTIVQDTIRTADIAARYDETQFVVLVFLDSENDLKHILKRVEKQLDKQNDQLKLDASYSFFSPDSSAKLAPMLEQARSQLASSQEQ